jgi:hypothetical protein
MRTLTLDIETIPIVEPKDDKFPPLADHQPVVVSMLISEMDSLELITYSADQGDTWEQSMLSSFDTELSKCNRIITWNGYSFDVPLLLLRALRHNVELKYLKSYWGYRYKDNHFDMMDRLGQFGGRQSIRLDGVAKLIGLPGKRDIDGGQVKDCWARGEYARVRKYCEEDVIQTYLIYLRYCHVLLGHDTTEFYSRASSRLLRTETEL